MDTACQLSPLHEQTFGLAMKEATEETPEFIYRRIGSDEEQDSPVFAE